MGRAFRVQRRGAGGERRRAAANRAGFVRLALALLGATVAGEIGPLGALVPWLWAYFGIAACLQVLIFRRICEGMPRVLGMGVLDLAVVTTVTIALGSAQSVMAFLYLLIPVTYATTTSRRRVSMVLATLACVAYVSVLAGEYLGALPGGAQSGSDQDGLLALATAALVVFSIAATTRLVSQLIGALSGANHRLRELSQRDELTQLHNRRYLLHRLVGELARVNRGATLAVAMVDLDGFKRVNDEEGHDAGDHLLKRIACALQKATRASDIVTRYGGDEFVILLIDTDRAGADVVAGRIVHNAREVGRETYPGVVVTASVGLVLARSQESPSDLLRRADAQVYAAKHAGGDRISVLE